VLVAHSAFAERCRQVCASHDWELLPTGILVRWGDGRRQLVRVEIFDSEGEALVRLSTTIGDTGRLGRERLVLALETNARLAHGALAIQSGQLCMTDTLMLENTDAGELEATIDYLSRRADEYERALFGTDEN
jgi:hypothetical protein